MFKSSCCSFKALAISFIAHCHCSVNCINEELATEGGYLRAIIAAWRNASKRSQNSVGMNWSARGKVKSALNSPKDWILCYIRMDLLWLQSDQCQAVRGN